MDIRGAPRRKLLCVLLAACAQPVTLDALVDELLGECPPRCAENAPQARISHLREKLRCADADSSVDLPMLLSGYRLLVAEENVDGAVFMRASDDLQGPCEVEPTTAVPRPRAVLAV